MAWRASSAARVSAFLLAVCACIASGWRGVDYLRQPPATLSLARARA